MIEIHDNSLVYVTIDEKATVDRLMRLKPPAAIYYRQTAKIGYHWLLNPVTIKRLKLTSKIP